MQFLFISSIMIFSVPTYYGGHSSGFGATVGVGQVGASAGVGGLGASAGLGGLLGY